MSFEVMYFWSVENFEDQLLPPSGTNQPHSMIPVGARFAPTVRPMAVVMSR